MTPVGIAALALVLSAGAAEAAPAEGLWQTPDDHGVVQISPCGEDLCGAVVTSDRLKTDPLQTDQRNADPSLRHRHVKGLTIFQGLKGGPTEWSGGSLYNPDDGKTYRGSMKLVGPNTMKVTGCVFFPLCRSETWTRLSGS